MSDDLKDVMEALREAGHGAEADALEAQVSGDPAARRAIDALRELGRHDQANRLASRVGAAVSSRELFAGIPRGANQFQARLLREWGVKTNDDGSTT